MDADKRGWPLGGEMRVRLGSLLVLAPLLALLVAVGAWVQSLRQQVASLEQRVTMLETLPTLLTATPPASPGGFPFDVDRAMQMDATMGVRR